MGRCNFVDLSSPLKSIGSQCCSNLCSTKINNGNSTTVEPAAMLQTGQCQFVPHEKSAHCNAALCQKVSDSCNYFAPVPAPQQHSQVQKGVEIPSTGTGKLMSQCLRSHLVNQDTVTNNHLHLSHRWSLGMQPKVQQRWKGWAVKQKLTVVAMDRKASTVKHPLENSVPNDGDGLVDWSNKIAVEVDKADGWRLERSHPVSCCSVRREV